MGANETVLGLARKIVTTLDRRMDTKAAMLSGVLSVVAYTITMEVDRKLTGSRIDDLVLLGRPAVPNNPSLARPVGAGIHLVNGAVIGAAYALLAHERLPGPPWLRGLAFLTVENTVLYPLAKWGDQVHPAVKDGQLDPYWTWPAFAESWPPHIVYGVMIGPLYERLRLS